MNRACVSVRLQTQPTKNFISIRVGEDAFEGNLRKALQVVGKAAINLEGAFGDRRTTSVRPVLLRCDLCKDFPDLRCLESAARIRLTVSIEIQEQNHGEEAGFYKFRC